MTQNELIKLSETVNKLGEINLSIIHIADYEMDVDLEASKELTEVCELLNKVQLKLNDFNKKYAKEKFNVVA